jgi:hypothetical protein
VATTNGNAKSGTGWKEKTTYFKKANSKLKINMDYSKIILTFEPTKHLADICVSRDLKMGLT